VDDVTFLSASDLLAGYRARSFTPSEVVTALARRIEAVEPALRAFVTLALEKAAAAAAVADDRWARGVPRPLEGVPFAAKDLFDTAGIRTTAGAAFLADHVPARDAVAVRRALHAGALLLGKTSTHEFAWGITGYNAHYDSGRNPWGTGHVTGGSSGGSAAAVAAGEVPLALGTDTGGSIRIPSAFCGVTGLKPTYARISAEGVFPLAPTLDHVGPMARSPEDLRLFLAVLADAPPPAAAGSLYSARIATCPDLMPIRPTAEVDQAVGRVLDALGAERREEPLGPTPDIRATFTTIQQAEALRTHRDAGFWPARRDEYGADVLGRFDAAEAVGFDDYLDATRARERIRARFNDLFGRVDIVVSPISPADPVELGAEEREHLGETVLFRDLVLPLTVPANVAGIPAVAVRAGFGAAGLPIGVQLLARAGSELLLLAAAERIAAATPEIQSRRPTL
jgi:aspartyl-tRNA(Asn)/glutamyl-tRNA(Gln) amidotransferase subunit A